jgi:hypothetical protein
MQSALGFSSVLKSMLLGDGKHLFLDLEDTVITPCLGSWQDVDFINIDLVKRVIEEFSPDTVSVFSFAIDDDADLFKFQEHVQPFLEKALGCKFTIVPHMEHVREVLADVNNFISKDSVSRMDINDFWNKQKAFRDWMSWNQRKHVQLGNPLPTITAFFLDDTVETETVCMPHLKLEVIMENPANLQ